MAEVAQELQRLRDISVPPTVKALVEIGRQRFDQQVQRLKETPLFIKLESVTRPGRERYDHFTSYLMCNGAGQLIVGGGGSRAMISGTVSYIAAETGIKSKLKHATLALIHPIV